VRSFNLFLAPVHRFNGARGPFSGALVLDSWRLSAVGHSLPAARRRVGREVRSSPIADLIPTPWLMLLALSNRRV
jgi:hypothetical protein